MVNVPSLLLHQLVDTIYGISGTITETTMKFTIHERRTKISTFHHQKTTKKLAAHLHKIFQKKSQIHSIEIWGTFFFSISKKCFFFPSRTLCNLLPQRKLRIHFFSNSKFFFFMYRWELKENLLASFAEFCASEYFPEISKNRHHHREKWFLTRESWQFWRWEKRALCAAGNVGDRGGRKRFFRIRDLQHLWERWGLSDATFYLVHIRNPSEVSPEDRKVFPNHIRDCVLLWQTRWGERGLAKKRNERKKVEKIAQSRTTCPRRSLAVVEKKNKWAILLSN